MCSLVNNLNDIMVARDSNSTEKVAIIFLCRWQKCISYPVCNCLQFCFKLDFGFWYKIKSVCSMNTVHHKSRSLCTERIEKPQQQQRQHEKNVNESFCFNSSPVNRNSIFNGYHLILGSWNEPSTFTLTNGRKTKRDQRKIKRAMRTSNDK